jgi:DOMON domain/Copper type II ascorbate-dependent monooxygenase, N-terminal domain
MKFLIASKFPLLLATGLPLFLLFGIGHAQNEVEDIVPLAYDQYFGGSEHSAYVSWYNTVQYSGSVYLPASNFNVSEDGNGAAIHWRVDETFLYVAVAARAQNGWVAMGIAEAGGMKGADIVIYESSKPDQLTDAHVLDERVPLVDDCQDWSLVHVQNENGFLIFEGKRLLNTTDGQDHVIINDSETMVAAQRIIAAWGDSDVMQYHGKTNRGRGSIRWYGTGDEYVFFRNTMAAKADGYFELFVNNYTVEAVDTKYVNFCFNWEPDIVTQGVPATENVAIIGAEIVLDKDGGKFVHHAAVSASHQTSNTSGTCLDTGKYDQFLYSWTPGALPLALPDDVGFTLGPAPIQGILSFQVQIHYNNPSLIEGGRDNGGLRVYYTKSLPTHEAGILPLGDMLTNLGGSVISTGTSRFDFSCDKQCSSLVLDEPVTVIHEYFHMHNRGKAGVQYQIRDGEVVHQANVNFFDFDQAGRNSLLFEWSLLFTFSNF